VCHDARAAGWGLGTFGTTTPLLPMHRRSAVPREKTVRRLAMLTMMALLAGSIWVPSVLAVPTCFGKRATIVGTNRDPFSDVPLEGTPGDDVIVGLRGLDVIDGRGGSDLICAGGGDDYIVMGPGDDKGEGGAGFDTFLGGRGHDRIWGGAGSDSLTGGPGNDRLFGGPGTEDSLIGGSGSDLMHGGGGYDRAEFWDAPRGIRADLRAGTATGYGQDRLVSIEGLVGSDHDDVLLGNELSNELQSGAGDDVVRAFGSADGGVDLLRTAGGDNLVRGGGGPDIVSYNATPWAVEVDLSQGTMTSAVGTDSLAGIEHIVGSKEDDILIGDDRDNVIFGSAGDDVMDGRGGVDEVAFDDSRVAVTADLRAGTAEADWWGTDSFENFENMAGSSWKDLLMGDGGPNMIVGWGRSDVLVGRHGDDELIGGHGTDQANGGAGIDRCEAEIHNCEVEIPAPSARLRLGASIWSTGIGGRS
jgi:Ca2+-binding RTX toxin-like protein